MNKYVYQIQGALENAQGKFCGFRVLVCNAFYFDSADIPVEVFDHETVMYMQYRLKLTEKIEMTKLPIKVQNDIRAPLGRWLDKWVLDNFYGDTSKSKSTNT